MPQLKITINSRSYDVACEDGQEQRLKEVADLLGDKVTQLVGALGQVGEARLLLMAGLLVADELYDVKAELAAGGGAASGAPAADAQDYVAGVFDKLATRLENLSAELPA